LGNKYCKWLIGKINEKGYTKIIKLSKSKEGKECKIKKGDTLRNKKITYYKKKGPKKN